MLGGLVVLQYRIIWHTVRDSVKIGVHSSYLGYKDVKQLSEIQEKLRLALLEIDRLKYENDQLKYQTPAKLCTGNDNPTLVSLIRLSLPRVQI